MAAFVIVGTALVFVLWSTLNDLLSGQLATGRLAVAVPALLLFIILLTFLARSVVLWEARHVE